MNTIISQVCTSIQGEGPNIGTPTLLIRFGNCNLNCDFCDTKWSNNMQLKDISLFTKITDKFFPSKIDHSNIVLFLDFLNEYNEKYKIKNVLITGGEPFMSNNINLIYDIIQRNHFNMIEIETNGVLLNLEHLNPILKCAEKQRTKIHLNISPKLDYNFYPQKFKSFLDILKIFKNINENIILSNINKLKYCYKFVYDKKSEQNILDFCDMLLTKEQKKLIYIMPNTPDYLKFKTESRFLKEFRESCYKTLEFCLKNNFTFSPRSHILLFNSFLQHNEFDDIK